MVDIDPEPGEAASGFEYWGGALGAVGGWFLGWFRAAFLLLVAMCPFGRPLVETGRENMDQSCLTCEYLDTSFLHVKLVGPPQSLTVQPFRAPREPFLSYYAQTVPCSMSLLLGEIICTTWRT